MRRSSACAYRRRASICPKEFSVAAFNEQIKDTREAIVAIYPVTKIDVLLSTYNGERYVAAAINSVLDQSKSDLHLYITDDCSEDDTWSIISTFNDQRIMAVRNETNKGLFNNINAAVVQTSSPYIKLLGQDDILRPNCLERSLRFARAHASVGCFWCYNETIDERGTVVALPPRDHVTGILSTAQADRDCLAWGCLSSNISNLFITRKALDMVGSFRTDIMSGDFEMMARIQGACDIARFTDVLVQIRSHKEQWSNDISQMENHLLGNLEIFDMIFKRAVEEDRSIGRREAQDLLVSRLARNEFNWLLKAMTVNRDLGAFWRCVNSMNDLISVSWVFSEWIRVMLPRYLSRINLRTHGRATLP